MTELRTAPPEAHGLPTGALLDLLDTLESEGLDPHALVVARDGAVLLRAAWAPYDHRRAALVYSVSKSVTALAVGLLAAEGRLALDDPVDRHLDLPNPHGITLRHLLTMTTGHSREQTLALGVPSPRALLTTAPADAVGSRFAYSSPATAVLARVVAAVAGEQPSAYLAPRLLRPLGIGARWWRRLDGVEEGFSGLHLTVEDQARLGIALAAGGAGVLPAGLVADLAGTWVPTVETGADDAGAEPDTDAADWARGYGFGVWRSRHGYRMDGAYGQFTVVVPETGVVVAYQGATSDTQRVLDVLWEVVSAFGNRAGTPGAGAAARRLAERVAGLDSWAARDRLVPQDGAGPDATGWSLTDRGADRWTLTLPRSVGRPGGALAVGPSSWTRGALTVDGDTAVVPVAARAERLPDGSVRAHLVATASPHRVLLNRSPAGALDARWHTAPLWQPELATLLVPPWGRRPGAGTVLARRRPFTGAMNPDTAVTVHPAWLPDAALAPLRDLPSAVLGSGPCLDTARAELGLPAARSVPASASGARLVIAPVCAVGSASDVGLPTLPGVPAGGHAIVRTSDRVVVLGADGPAALRGLYALAREVAVARLTGSEPGPGTTTSAPEQPLRMLDHWDNVAVHPVMGQVERGYSGGSIFYADGEVRADLTRVRDYARLLAATGVEAVAINNVNVHAREARLLTDGLDDVARIADVFRSSGIRIFLSVSFASPMLLGGLGSADPLDPAVAAWWASAADRVYAAVPDFGGFLVKADSEGQPGPFAYGRTHADGANMLAAALRPHGGTVLWRAFVYNHEQDWRDRRTDRARAAYDHFAPLDGTFADEVVLQVKHGPMDFQVREPVSPVLAAMPRTRLALELQITQEYTGQQRHVCYLAPAWREWLGFRLDGTRSVASIVAGRGGVAGVSNVGDDAFWTGHPLAQANLYAFGRLAWDSTLTAEDVLDEWIALTFAAASGPELARLRAVLHRMMDDSWQRYEGYTAPLGVGFMVTPGTHGGPAVDGYEYSPWGTYHFADRDGIGVDRSVATGTGYAGQYPAPWRGVYESVETCPDELLLFFHHVPYTHVLGPGKTVIQHVYDSRAEAVEGLDAVEAAWGSLADLVGGAVPAEFDARIRERLEVQRASAVEWRDQVRSYFWRKSGVRDTSGRVVY